MKTQKAVASFDTSMRIAQGASLIQEFQAGVTSRLKKMASANKIARLPKAEAIYDLKVSLIGGETNVGVTNRIGHVVSINTDQALLDSGQWHGELKALSQQNPSHASSTKLPDGVAGRCVTRVADTIWIPYTDGDQPAIRAFTLTGEETGKPIMLPPKVGHVTAVVQTKREHAKLPDSEFAVVASDAGLFSITRRGHVVQEVAAGSFSDVSLSSGALFALEHKQQQVACFEFSERGWAETMRLDVKHADSSIHDTLHVTRHRIYVACWFGDEIHSYALTGDKLGRYKDKQVSKAGDDAGGKNNKKSSKSMKKATVQIANPRLCGSDDNGALLYCDSGNRRIQMLSSDLQWGATVLQGLTVQPVYVTQQQGAAMIILGADNTLQHFTFQ